MNTRQKSRGGFSSFIAALCIIVYLFALTQAIVRFYFSVDRQKTTAEQEFSKIAALALTAGLQGFMDERFVSAMNGALASSECVDALIISGPEGEYGFEKQQGRALTWTDNSPRFINKLGFSKENFFRPLPIHDLRDANIKAVAVIFDYNEISKILKETLFLILVGFTIAFITMLIQALLGKSSQSKTYAEAPSTSVSIRYVDESETSSRENVSSGGPKGLYSDRSGIGWEEYTKDRLDSELHRCSSSEHDLTLLIIESSAFKSDNIFAAAAEEAVSFFSSRDLLFERGETGMVVILPGIDLHTGISKAERFHLRVIDRFQRGFNNKSNLFIGLSARSGRLLDADRLMFETAAALKKAKSDPKSSIIAFKTDPEKYRAFLNSQG